MSLIDRDKVVCGGESDEERLKIAPTVMDNVTYDQIPLNKEQIGDCLKYLKENMEVKILSFKGKVFAIEPPIFVELEVTYTEPGFAGNTTTTSGKPATLETGLEIQVPMFINIGDIIKIDTRTCQYMERV